MLRRLVLVSIAWAAVGCTSFPRPVDPFTDGHEALRLQSLTRADVHGIRAEARIDQRGDDGRIKGTVLMFVVRPGFVRFDAMTQFGPAAILTSDGDTFAYADLRNTRFTTGKACPANVARLLNLPLSVEQTTELLLGGTPVLEGARAQVAWNGDGFYRVTLRDAKGQRQEVDLGISEHDAKLPRSRQRLRLLRSEVYDARGKTLQRLSYDEYRDLQQGTYRVAVPFLVRVEQPKAGRDTLIRFKEIALDPSVTQSVFYQVPSPGMHVEVSPCE
jgi:hypothetical protein